MTIKRKRKTKQAAPPKKGVAKGKHFHALTPDATDADIQAVVDAVRKTGGL